MCYIEPTPLTIWTENPRVGGSCLTLAKQNPYNPL